MKLKVKRIVVYLRSAVDVDMGLLALDGAEHAHDSKKSFEAL